jgi:hypothetical protein
MKTTNMLGLAAAAALATACGAIPVQMNTSTTIQHADGTVEHKESHWEGTLDQLPGQLAKAGQELGEVTSKMAKELTDVPSPGKVELKDLGPGFEKYQGKRETDFLSQAKDADGKPITFSYVRLGVASYDDFFKTAQEIYALCYQTTQATHRMRELSAKLNHAKADASANLKAEVDKALEAEGGADASLTADLRLLAEMSAALAVVVPQIVSKVSALVSQGQSLIASAPTSITNPKVATHLPLIKEGLTSSIKVITESGSLMGKMSGEISGFKS